MTHAPKKPLKLSGDDVRLMRMCHAGRAKEAREYLLNQANPNGRDKDGATVLIVCCGRGYKDIVDFLLTSTLIMAVDVDAQDSVGSTALHHAVMKNRLEIAKLLLDKGNANPNILDKYGRSPLHWAVSNGSEKIVDLLIEYFADATLRDKSGLRPVQIAHDHGHQLLEKTLRKNQTVGYDNRQQLAEQEMERIELEMEMEKTKEQPRVAVFRSDTLTSEEGMRTLKKTYRQGFNRPKSPVRAAISRSASVDPAAISPNSNKITQLEDDLAAVRKELRRRARYERSLGVGGLPPTPTQRRSLSTEPYHPHNNNPNNNSHNTELFDSNSSWMIT